MIKFGYQGGCGIDMTDDFKDKAGAGRNHKEGHTNY